MDRIAAHAARTRRRLTPVVVFALAWLLLPAAFAGQQPPPSSAQPAWAAKISPSLARAVQAQGETEFFLVLASQADLSPAVNFPSRLAKSTFVVASLRSIAARTQPGVIADLNAMHVTFTPFWVANMILVRGDARAVDHLAQRADVARLFANPRLVTALPTPVQAARPLAPAVVSWNLDKVNAPQVWAAGHVGQGVVVGGQDTGYQWNHPALINQYRGWNGSSADHNYNWHDAIHGSGGDLLQPLDDYGHGTHTMGTIVGNDLAPGDPAWPAGATNAIGVAPGAKWIGCRNMKNGVGTPATYAECYQWFMAPTDLAGQHPNVALAPDVINNSWTCPASEGCTDVNVLEAVVANVRAAGILTVHSAGNSGAACSTVAEPAALYAGSFTVGATDSADAIAGFSSRGPVIADGSGRMKPELSAPGVNVRSAYVGGGYATMDGTSMAGPHVAGAAALILSARPSLAGNVSALEMALTRSAFPRTTAQGCGGDSSSAVPNNVYGWGRLDANAALHRIIDVPIASVTTIGPAGGPTGGGTTVTITGANFPAEATVAIGGAALTSVTRVSAATITGTTAAHGAGLFDVVVTGPDLQTATLAAGFAYGNGLPTFTDDPLHPPTTPIKAVHVTELRQRIDQLRVRYALGPFGWTDPLLLPGATTVKAAHVAELRAALGAVYTVAGRTSPAYADPTIVAGQTVVTAAHIGQLRAAILAIW